MRVATDIGGTFTDVVYADEAGIRGRKVLSTPRSPDLAVADAISVLPVITSFSHGTTVATNALLERKGARVAFVVTEGFRDLLHIARQTRPRLYDFDCSRPEPLVGSDLCFEVPERLSHDGSVVTPLSEASAAAVADAVKKSGADVAAVCLLFSYQNPEHEVILEQALQTRGIPVSRSSHIIPEFREYERASTTVINAFVQPVVREYLGKIRRTLHEAGGPSDYFVMKSTGGVATSQEVAPAEVLLSGPAGGVAGAVALSRETGRARLVTFDMGGTSADFSAVVDHTPIWTDEGEIGGLPGRLPMIDIVTVGAGGGSIARLDSGGALRVGPDSAGADPGPVCYHRGGLLPTVTDANLLAGLLDPSTFRRTGISLDVSLGRAALSNLASAAHVELEEAVLGVRSVVNATMLRGMRRATVEKGIDVRTCSLLAFGGAGPLHAADLARELAMKEVIIPPLAGVFSALGILFSDIKLDYSRSLLAAGDDGVAERVEPVLDEFKARAEESLQRQGVEDGDRAFAPLLDVRYRGQSFHLSIPYVRDAHLKQRFTSAFEARYGYRLPDTNPIEIVNVRLAVTARRGGLAFPGSLSGYWDRHEERSRSPVVPQAPGITARTAVRRTRILEPAGWLETPVMARGSLLPGFALEGPAVVEDEGCTIYVPSDFRLSVETSGCIILTAKDVGGCPTTDALLWEVG